jgi:hypothetical protein
MSPATGLKHHDESGHFVDGISRSASLKLASESRLYISVVYLSTHTSIHRRRCADGRRVYFRIRKFTVGGVRLKCTNSFGDPIDCLHVVISCQTCRPIPSMNRQDSREKLDGNVMSGENRMRVGVDKNGHSRVQKCAYVSYL